MIEHTVALHVRYAETDQMGVAHHANYPVWFEVARVELMRAYGMSYARFEESDYYMPLVELNIQYRKAIHFDDRISIRARLNQLPRARIIFDYEVFDADENRVASGQTVHGFMNREEKAVKPPRAFIEKLAPYFTAG
jgi:acyl-CoA thioester hydrolase